MALPWLKLGVDALDSPQAQALAFRVGDPRGVFYPVALLVHAARHYPGGSLPDSEGARRSLEAASLWSGEAGALVAALLATGYLRRRLRRLEVVGWREVHAAHVEKLEADRARMRRKRAAEREKRRATVRAEETERESKRHSKINSNGGTDSRKHKAIAVLAGLPGSLYDVARAVGLTMDATERVLLRLRWKGLALDAAGRWQRVRRPATPVAQPEPARAVPGDGVALHAFSEEERAAARALIEAAEAAGGGP